MKRFVCLMAAGLLLLSLCGCRRGGLPFRQDEVESMTVYRFECVPTAAEKKTAGSPQELEAFYRQAGRLADKAWNGEALAGGSVISVRARLRDGTVWEAVYTFEAAKTARALWDGFDGQTQPAQESELPTTG